MAPTISYLLQIIKSIVRALKLKLNLNMNDQMSMEEMEAFLIEAELVNQKVKALAENRMSP